MKKSLKSYFFTKDFCGFKIAVYGERWEDGKVDGLFLTRAKLSKDGKTVLQLSDDTEQILLDRPYTRTRYFNMGWAICSPRDKYSEEFAIELCKKRFRKSPLVAKTGLFLTNDMVYAILQNEIEYIIKHWQKFVPVNNEKEAEPVNTPASEPVKEEVVPEEPLEVIVPGKFVTILNPKDPNWPTVVGYVKKTEPGMVYYDWIAHFNDNLFEFNYSYGRNDLFTSTENLRLSTAEEVAQAILKIKKNVGIVWDAQVKAFKKNK